MAMVNLANLERLVNEVAENDKASTNSKLFTDIRSENEKESKNVKKDADERVKDSTPTKSSTQIDGYRGEQPPSGRNALNLNYDHIDKKYQERVKALVQGKASPNQADIDDEASGISTKGNKTFYDNAQKDNKGYANVMGYTQINDRIAQPPKGTPKFSTDESKIKIGDVFTETKKGINLQVAGINEDKTRISFIDESNKKYSLATDKFKQAIKENTMIKKVKPIVENKIKVGDVFKETKNGTTLKFTGLNEDKTRVSLIDESNKKYSLSLDKFKKAIKEEKMVRELPKEKSDESIKESAPFVATAIKDAKVADKVKDKNAVGNVNADQNTQQQDETPQENKTVTESKTKRLVFKKLTFISEEHAKRLIPEHYKVPGTKFAMIDREGNEFLMESDKFQQAIVLEYKNIEKGKKEMERMKQLWEYNPGKTKGGFSLNEAQAQRDIQQKTKRLMEKKN